MTQEKYEEKLVALMLHWQSIIDDVQAELSSDVEDVVIEMMKDIARHETTWIMSFEGMKRLDSFEMELKGLMDSYSETLRESLLGAYRESFSTFVGQAPTSGGDMLEDEAELLFSIEEAVTNFKGTFTMRINSLLIILRQQSVLEDNEVVFTNLIKETSTLLYQLSRHLKYQMSFYVNLGIIQEAYESGVEAVEWNTRPEMTVSGTCDSCLRKSRGGINESGIYPTKTAPIIPDHPFCVCVYIPVRLLEVIIAP